jgi:CubicO group peptidase (beta-lactamase class C family)
VGNRGISFVPPDIFYALGYQGQVIVIIPSRELVVVRLGMTRRGNWDFYTFVKELLKAL